ncbi:MAG: hypothetical protein ACXVCP_02250 [Bdellovibrio sp.]
MGRIFLLFCCYFSVTFAANASEFKVNYLCLNGDRFEYSINQNPTNCNGIESGCYEGWLVRSYVLDGSPKQSLTWTIFKASEIITREQKAKELNVSCPKEKVKVIEVLDLSTQKPISFTTCTQEENTLFPDPKTGDIEISIRKSVYAVDFPLSMALSDSTFIGNKIQMECTVESFQK